METRATYLGVSPSIPQPPLGVNYETCSVTDLGIAVTAFDPGYSFRSQSVGSL